MNTHSLPGRRALALAERLFAPETVERVIEPAVADLQHEWQAAADKRKPAVRRGGNYRLALVMLGCVGQGALRLPWHVLLFAVGLAFTGVWVLTFSDGIRPSYSALQGTWLTVGAVVAVLVLAFNRMLLRPTPWVIAALVISALPQWSSVPYLQPAWFEVGSLRIHAATAAMPFLLLALATLRSRRLALGLVGVVVALTCLQLQFTNAVVILLGASAAMHARHGRLGKLEAALAIMAVLGLTVAAMMPSGVPTYPHTDKVLWLAIEHGGLPALFAIFACLSGLVVALVLFARKATPVGKALALGTATLLAAQTLAHLVGEMGWLASPGGHLPLVSYGGSAVVGWGILLGAAASRRASSTGRVVG